MPININKSKKNFISILLKYRFLFKIIGKSNINPNSVIHVFNVQKQKNIYKFLSEDSDNFLNI